jgi:uncharacterized membrane protein
MDIARTASLVAATVTVGLMAGLFFAFSYSVMPGLARTEARTFVEAMRRINVAIVNAWFLICFLGALVFTALAAILHRGAVLAWVVAGLVLYVVTLFITVRFNIPLNNQLAAGDGDPAVVRERFEDSWVRWNMVRSAASLAAFGCLVGALLTS